MAPSEFRNQADASENTHYSSPPIGGHDPTYSLQVLTTYQSRLSSISLPKEHQATLSDILNIIGNIHNYLCQHAKHRWEMYQVFTTRQHLTTSDDNKGYAELLREEIQDANREMRLIEAGAMVKILGEMERTLGIAKLTVEEVLRMGKETAGPEVRWEVEEQKEVVGEIEEVLGEKYEELYLDLRDMCVQYVDIFR